jgi:hypothetical protein
MSFTHHRHIGAQMNRIATIVLALAAASSACFGPSESPSQSPTGPRAPVTTPIAVDADGLARPEVWLSSTDMVRTLGVAVLIEGADVLEWTRDDGLFTQNGGRVIPLETKVVDNTFRMIVGTTAPGTASDAGLRLASFVLKPRVGETVRLTALHEGLDLGAVDATGQRIDVAGTGKLSIRSGGAQ